MFSDSDNLSFLANWLVYQDGLDTINTNSLWWNSHFQETLPLYLEAVRDFSLANTKCCLVMISLWMSRIFRRIFRCSNLGGFEEDRRVLEAKINEAYVSKDHFEVLVQAMPWI